MKGKVITMTTSITKVISSAAAIAMAASMTSGSCMAAGADINISSIISNSAIGGDANIITTTRASGQNVSEQVNNIIQNSVVGGDTNIVDVSTLVGSNVVKTGTNLIDGFVTGGSLSITNISDIFGNNIGCGFTNLINNGVVAGNTDISNIINSQGPAGNLQVSIQDILSNTVTVGDFTSVTGINGIASLLPDKGTDNPCGTPCPDIPEPEEVPQPGSVTDNRIAQEILASVNAARAAQGLNALVLDPRLTEMAQYKAEDMAVYGYSHEGSYGSLSDLLNKFNMPYSYAGENIALNQESSAEVMNDWMNSEGHRANILSSNYSKLGVGYYEYNGNRYWVQEFVG